MTLPPRVAVRLHLTNVTGAGATQLLQSLLPALERDQKAVVECIYLPDRGPLADYVSLSSATLVEVFRRRLPRALSRVLECTLFAYQFNGDTPLIVLGDLPLRCNSSQIVFVQQSNLLRPKRFRWRKGGLRYWLARVIFAINHTRVRAFIVQTDVMRIALERMFPDIAGRVYVISQPVPTWLLYSGLKRSGRVKKDGGKLKLVYPAADYPHKNHILLSRIPTHADCPVEELILTINSLSNPASHLSWVRCSGFLSPEEMIKMYSEVDALLFMSKEESYGFPLVEAMFVGVPIICPDLEYARVLCGSEAIYFDPNDATSLVSAIQCLNSRLELGWWPHWEDRLIHFPPDWETVAERMLQVVRDA